MKKRSFVLVLALVYCLTLCTQAMAAESKAGAQLAVSDIAEGKYTGTLSGDSYISEYDKYTISPDISPSQLTVTIKDGSVGLHSAASVTAGGTIAGVEAPRSPGYTQTVSGTLPLVQSGDVLRAEGDLAAPSETIWIYWDDNMRFTRWEVAKAEKSSYHCTVTIAMADGAPVAEITVDGSTSHRTCRVPLKLNKTANAAAKTDKKQAELWTNYNKSAVKNKARAKTVEFELPACTVTELETYHYKSGGKKPGKITLISESGETYGPFQAKGRKGQGGVKNACWVAKVNIELPAGRYAIKDSDPDTWSNNSGSGGLGFAAVRGLKQ